MIEKVHGINATCLTLDERFTHLASANVIGPRRRPSFNAGFANQNNNNFSRAWIEELTRQLEQAKKLFQAQHGSPRMFGRLGNGAGVPGLRRANSWSNMSQQSYGKASWRQSNGDLSSNRSVSFGGSTSGRRMRFKRRGMRRNRGVFNQNVGGALGRGRRAPAGVGRGGMRRAPGRGRGQGRGGNRGRGRGGNRGRGGVIRNQTKPLPTREELDKQLDQYMSGTKAALDKQLDEYMQNAMEFDI